MPEMTACRECKGTGRVPNYAREGEEPKTTCPWCEGGGQVERAYLVMEHGHNGDSSFSEIVTVVFDLDEAKARAMKVMTVDRHEHVHDGRPTVQWVEIFGPDIEESLGLEEQAGELVWTP